MKNNKTIMKKAFFFFLFIPFLPLASQAQFKIGLRAGLSTPKIDSETADASGGYMLALKEAKYGYHLGLFVRGHLSEKVYLQPEFLFNSNSVDFTLEGFGSGLANRVLTEKYQNLDIPFMLGYKLGPLRLEGGPVGHIHIASKSELDDLEGYEQRFQDFQLGYQVGGGLDIWRLLVDVRYEGNFNNFGEHMRIAGEEVKFSQNPARIVMTVGYSF